MIDESTLSAQEIKNKQHRNLLVIAGIAVIVVCGIYYVMGDDSSDVKKADATTFVGPMDQVNTQSVWQERTQNKLKEQERQTAELKSEITQLKSNDQAKSLESDPRFVALQKQNQILEESLKVKHAQTNANAMDGGSDYKAEVFSTTPGARGVNGQTRPDLPDSVGIDNNELNLKSNLSYPKKNKNSFVSAGTFAEAIMLGAADASAGVQAQSNPSPMLFRIVANGTLPNHQKSHLKNCVVTAAVVGDISSERGQIRLERMSCTFPNGEIVEQQVDGTVFGMDAKSGVRGNPVWREGALLGRAAIAGTLSGLGSAVSQTYTTNSISPLGSTQTVNNGDIFKYGAAQGASNAMEKLAEYNIRRAEQYHPVIQLSAGQPVDVVFLKGFYLDGRKHEETADERSEPTKLFTPSFNPTATGLTLSERELEKIKQNEEANGWVSRNQSGGV